MFRELAANIFPIESVYGTVEVKADLSIDELRKAAAATTALRQMAKQGKYYAAYYAGEMPSGVRADLPPAVEHHMPSKLAPRSYVVGYDVDAATPDSFVNRLVALAGAAPDIFLHGIYAIHQDWFFCQNYGQTTFQAFSENGLLTFVSKLIADLQSFGMGPVALSRYVENERLRDLTASPEQGVEGQG